MRVIFLMLTGLLFNAPILAQGNSFELPRPYKGQGVVFKDKAAVQQVLPGVLPVELSMDDIQKAESILAADYQHYLARTMESTLAANALTAKQKRAWAKTVRKANAAKAFKRYNRQYFGYVNSQGQKVICVLLIDFGNRRKAADYFADWQTELQVGFGEFYEAHSRMYKVNLSEGLLDAF